MNKPDECRLAYDEWCKENHLFDTTFASWNTQGAPDSFAWLAWQAAYNTRTRPQQSAVDEAGLVELVAKTITVSRGFSLDAMIDDKPLWSTPDTMRRSIDIIYALRPHLSQEPVGLWQPLPRTLPVGDYLFGLWVEHQPRGLMEFQVFHLELTEEDLRDANGDFFGEWQFEDFELYMPAPKHSELENALPTPPKTDGGE